jgi:uracil-DNA glycosylase
MLKSIFHPTWYKELAPFMESEEIDKILHTLRDRANSFNTKIYPKFSDTFNVFKEPLDSYKVVILGQDPYHTEGMAIGYSFAVPQDKPAPPSLKNIIEEVELEYDTLLLTYDSTLKAWRDQGVLLLNTALTVERGRPGSHLSLWKPFTQEVIAVMERTIKPLYLVLGKKAEAVIKENNVDAQRCVITSHPSPFSVYRGFRNSGIFKKINELLDTPIDWTAIKDY